MFTCQRDTFLKEVETEITSCKKLDLEESTKRIKEFSIEIPSSDSPNGVINGKGDSNEGQLLLELTLKDTILFPEGGGQPDDRGTIGGFPVLRVIRRGNLAIHYCLGSEEAEKGLQGGSKVHVEVDWSRRWDNVQQHSGQHLITAITDQLYGFNTTSWWLGAEESFIELSTDKELTKEQMQTIENKVNQLIRDCRPVEVDVVELDDPKLKIARGRNLPEDVKGQIRIVTMNGVESNVCCGTHVSNLNQLQVIKLLSSSKRKGKALLFFLCGERVIKRFTEMHNREQKLMDILRTCNTDLPSAAEKLNIALKGSKKMCSTLTKDLVGLEAKRFLENNPKPKFWSYHRDNVEMEFGQDLLKELSSDKDTLIFISLKVEGNNGHFFLRGNERLDNAKLIQIGEEVCQILEAKGTLRGNLYQGKAIKISGVPKAIKAIQTQLENSNVDQL